MKPRQYGEIAVDIAVAVVAYYFLHWIGFALWVFFVACNYGYQIGGWATSLLESNSPELTVDAKTAGGAPLLAPFEKWAVDSADTGTRALSTPTER